MGALIENAARLAHRRVRICGSDEGHAVTLSVEDDGPGIDMQRREQALIREIKCVAAAAPSKRNDVFLRRSRE